MTHHWDPGRDHGSHCRADLQPPFQLHRVTARFLEKAAAVDNGITRTALIRTKRHIADNKGPRRSPADSRRVMNHLVHGHRHGRVIPQNHHPQRISHQQDIHATTGNKGRHGGIVGSEYGDLGTGPLHGHDLSNGFSFGHNNPPVSIAVFKE